MALSEFETLVTPVQCGEKTLLVMEGEQSTRVMLLVAGRVKLSVNSIDGRRLTVEIAEAGDILGLASAVSGCPSQITAEAWFPCRMASLPRQGFLDFLFRHPVAWQNVSRQLSEEFQRSCEQLRNLGLPFTATTKLARLLLKWSADGRLTERGIRIQCSLTHGEIGEFIGVARETVSRTLSDFRNRELVHQHGSIMFTRICVALNPMRDVLTIEGDGIGGGSIARLTLNAIAFRSQ